MTLHWQNPVSKGSQAKKPTGITETTSEGTTSAAADAMKVVAALREQMRQPKAMASQLTNKSGPLNRASTDLDQRLEQSLRPESLADYIGQSSLHASLNIAIEAAKQREEPLDHVLLYGPPGLGKTSLAMVLSKAMGANIHLTSASCS